MRIATHADGIVSQFAHVTRAKFPYLRGDAVFFHEGFLEVNEILKK